jgi:HSP20 family protein
MVIAKRKAISPLADPFNMFEALFSDPFTDRTDGVSLKTLVESIDNNYVFSLELPGFDENEIDIQVRNGQLQIVAEHKDTNGKFFHTCVQRTWSLPEPVDQDNVEAILKNGVLTVKVPKKIVEKVKKIAVKTAE